MPTYYRTARGGQVPLGRRERRQFITLYEDLDVPVAELAGIFNVHISTIYRWMPHLGILPQGSSPELRVLEGGQRKAG